ncbi:hypothetical protein RRG08_002203 [Elysia crispata]|uniref:Uncharacterized protein n=1 Tax=Elysia crispata TaxID=231223 RepID=A0AAE1DDI5_9GAST|nr:hypothetical protein RRG08_002203 [Elysia crispata]
MLIISSSVTLQVIYCLRLCFQRRDRCATGMPHFLARRTLTDNDHHVDIVPLLNWRFPTYQMSSYQRARVSGQHDMIPACWNLGLYAWANSQEVCLHNGLLITLLADPPMGHWPNTGPSSSLCGCGP